jgi:glycosyltransferase involved in cell wall biosynthesis
MKNKIKICYILSCLSQGGAERQTLNLIKGLNIEKYDITLLIYESKDIFFLEVYDLPIHLVINESTQKNKFLRTYNRILFLKRFLIQNDFDILHTLLHHNGFWVRLLAPKKFNHRIIYSIRNSLVDSTKFFLFFEKYFMKNSFVITNNQKSRDQFISLVGDKYRNRILNIYNGFEIDKFVSSNHFLDVDHIYIGTVGRQTKQKNQLQILRVIKNISEVYPVYFYLIGNKTLDKGVEISNFIEEKHLDKFVSIIDSQPAIEQYYKMFDIFILSSLFEGCPNVLFEAMLSKCLCIVSEGSNSDNFVIDGINGFVYDGSDSMLESKLRHAIELLYNKQINEIITNGYLYALNNFSNEKMISSYENIYEKVLFDLQDIKQ